MRRRAKRRKAGGARAAGRLAGEDAVPARETIPGLL